MTPRRLQQLIGMILLLLGLAALTAAWASPHFRDPLVREIEAALSACAILGLGMLILPSPREERTRRGDDLWELSGLRMITARWWLVILLALAVGGGHFALVRDGQNPSRQLAEQSTARTVKRGD